MSKIYGVALSKDGEPVPGVTVELVSSGGEAAGRHETGDDGIFEFEVQPGTWELKWTPAGGESSEGTVDVAEGDDAEVELEIAE